MSDPIPGRPRPPSRPPEEGEERTDPFGWLYRDEPSGRTRPGADAPPVPPSGAREPRSPGAGPAPGSSWGANVGAAGGPYGAAPSGPTPPGAYSTQGAYPAQGAYPTQGEDLPQRTPAAASGYPPTVAYTPPRGAPSPGLAPYGSPPTGIADPVFGMAETVPSGPGPNGAPRRRRGPIIAVILIAVLLVVGLAGGALLLLHPETLVPPGSRPPPSSPPSSTSASESAYGGALAPITATAAMADCVAPDGVDAAGTPVPYKPANVIDDDPATAWRCDGDGVGQQITLALPGSTVAQLGFVNGYAKIDPADGSNRYPEYRRILEVEWRLSNGTTFTQTAKDGTEGIQTLAIPVQHDITSVSLVIKRVTAPGLQNKTRDAVLISTIQLSAPA